MIAGPSPPPFSARSCRWRPTQKRTLRIPSTVRGWRASIIPIPSPCARPVTGAGLGDGLHGRRPVGEANGRTVVLLHGKNFCCGATWERTISVLTEAGYRVVAPDQIGFCKSAKPPLPVQLTRPCHRDAWPDRSARDREAVVVGPLHGRHACRPLRVDVPGRRRTARPREPIGLEDWQAKGVPYQSSTTPTRAS